MTSNGGDHVLARKYASDGGSRPFWRRLILFLVILSLVSNSRALYAAALTAPAPTASANVAANTVPILIKFRSAATPQQMDDAVRAGGGTVARDFLQIHTRVINVPTEAADRMIAAYASFPAVERAAGAVQVSKAGTPNDPGFTKQWSLAKVSWDLAYGVVPISGSAKIAVLDTGVDASHPDLAGNVVGGQSFTGGNAGSDPNGHGTALAGIAAASTNNSAGMAGVAYAGTTVSPVQVLGADGTGLDSDVVAGVLWAADNGANVILMGFSSANWSGALADALDYAWNKGVVLVAATGNDGSTGPTFPAAMANVLGAAVTPPPSPTPLASPTPGPTPTYLPAGFGTGNLFLGSIAGANEDYIYSAGNTIVADAAVEATDSGHKRYYKYFIVDAAGTVRNTPTCTANGSGGPVALTYTVQSSDPASTTTADYTFKLRQYTDPSNPATALALCNADTNGTGTREKESLKQFDVAKATAYTSSALTTQTTLYQPGASAFVTIAGMTPGKSDWDVTWIAPSGSTSPINCANNGSGDR